MLQADNKNSRIAKNAMLLYLRMLFMMFISLYTSRIVLRVLGIEDYGMYNVVAGVITMLGLLNAPLSNAASRFITFSLGKNDNNLANKVFGNILTIHVALAILTVVLGETVGLWFLETQLNIPQGRENAAFWVYQFSVATAAVSILNVPYYAAIIAHERMSAFAYITVLDAVLKLVIVFAIGKAGCDRLILYALLFCIVQIIDQIIYMWFSFRKLENTRSRPQFDRKIFREIMVFAGWITNGCIAYLGFTQGLNVLLNIFFGPAVNAARGIAVQVQAVVQKFCSNFQMAINPQLIKSYANNDLANMHTLIIVSSKFAFFLVYLMSLPIILGIDTILEAWLEDVPEKTNIFCVIMLVICLCGTLTNPLSTSIQATGRIKKYQLYEGTLLLLIVPVSYIALKFFNATPESVFLIHLALEIIAQVFRVRITLREISMKISRYLREVILPVAIVVPVSAAVPGMVSYLFNTNGLPKFIVTSGVSVISVAVVVYFIGCSNTEKLFIRKKIAAIAGRKI